MKTNPAKPANLRPQAEHDFVLKLDYYLEVNAPSTVLAERFFHAADLALRSVERRPGIGSLRIGEFRGVPSLRSWPVKGFSMQWFYFERESHIYIVRLLSDRQDGYEISESQP